MIDFSQCPVSGADKTAYRYGNGVLAWMERALKATHNVRPDGSNGRVYEGYSSRAEKIYPITNQYTVGFDVAFDVIIGTRVFRLVVNYDPVRVLSISAVDNKAALDRHQQHKVAHTLQRVAEPATAPPSADDYNNVVFGNQPGRR